MRYSILGFNQSELIKYDVDMTDVLLMDYIQKALSQPSMIKTNIDEQPYVWLNHSKILDDLPILNIKESMLKKRIANLIEIGLIKSITVANTKGRGSRSYYTVTEQFEQLQYDNVTEGNKLPLKERPSVKNYPSNNKLNNTINKTISKDIVEDTKYSEPKTKKKNLYQKCMDMIDEYTNNAILWEYLSQFLKICLENSREAGRPFYQNMWKSKLTKLSELSDNTDMQIKIVKQTLDNGWSNFYEYKGDRKKTGNTAHDIEKLYGGINERADKEHMTYGEKF